MPQIYKDDIEYDINDLDKLINKLEYIDFTYLVASNIDFYKLRSNGMIVNRNNEISEHPIFDCVLDYNNSKIKQYVKFTTTNLPYIIKKFRTADNMMSFIIFLSLEDAKQVRDVYKILITKIINQCQSLSKS